MDGKYEWPADHGYHGAKRPDLVIRIKSGNQTVTTLMELTVQWKTKEVSVSHQIKVNKYQDLVEQFESGYNTVRYRAFEVT